MSVAAAQHRSSRRPSPSELPEGIARRGMALSGALHLAVIALLVFGLPTLFSPPPPREMPIAVDLVNLGSETRATQPNLHPQHFAKPVKPIPGPEVAKPVPKPEPAKQTSPASAAAAPVPRPVQQAEAKPLPTPPMPPPPMPQAKPEPPPIERAISPRPLTKPEPSPVETAAAPRPQEKPEPPKPAVVAARVEARKYNPGRFDALLRNLAATTASASPDAPPRQLAMTAGRPSSQPEAPLGQRLSASELDMLREQISRCWDVPAGARDDKNLVVEIRVVVSPDGNVERAMIVDQARAAADPFFRAAAESARRAFFNPECRPLRLPPNKYELWRNMVVDFSPKDLS
jgi:outer membrane biosynthesis protein TonB